MPTSQNLGLRRGWPSEWSITVLSDGQSRETAVADTPVDALLDAEPIRTATWHPGATARAGLHYVAAVQGHRFHESLFERNLLVAVDFHGAARVASQPFTLTWRDQDGHTHQHTPDFVFEAERTVTVVNVRPERRVKADLLRNCAAVEEVCLHRGWQHVLVVDYPRPAFTNIAGVAAHRAAQDRFGYAEDLLTALDSGPLPFAELADRCDAPVIARAIIQRLIWDRELSIDLNQLLGDRSLVALAGEEPHS